MKEPVLFSIGARGAYRYSEKLKAAFVYPLPFDQGEVNVSIRDGDWLLVPREMGKIGPKTRDDRTRGAKIEAFRMRAEFPPRNSEQSRLIAESFRHLHYDVSHILQASTGVGKTYVGISLAARLGLKTLVVVHKSDLEARWREDALKFTDLQPEDIGTIRQNKCEYQGRKLCIGMIHSLAKDKYPAALLEQFGFVIFDECHHVPADTFQLVGGMFPALLRLGLSATASRSDGKDFIFRGHLGEILVQSSLVPMAPKILVKNTGFRLPRVPRKVRGEWRTVPLPHEAGKMGHVTKLLAQDEARNRVLIEFICACYRRGRHVVALSDLARENHLDSIHSMLTQAGVPETDIGFYVGGMSKVALEEAKTKKIVLGTYAMASEGTDVPVWSALAMLTPRSKIVQILGRILREHPGKPQPVVLDLVDEDSDVCAGYYTSRMKQYRSPEINAEVKLL